MTEQATATDRFRAILVLAATAATIIFNWLAAIGRVGGVTPAEISAMYPTLITPAGYAFSIWSLIYLGLIAFSIYQLTPLALSRFRNIRSLYILSYALNCAWIYMWHHNRIAICMIIITCLLATLFVINLRLRSLAGHRDYWLAKAPFSIYFGWVTAATLVNFAILLVYLDIQFTPATNTAVAVGLILIAGILAVSVRKFMGNYLYPLAVGWAVAAIGVKQSGQTAIVLTTAIVLIVCLIAALSFVVNLPSSSDSRS